MRRAWLAAAATAGLIAAFAHPASAGHSSARGRHHWRGPPGFAPASVSFLSPSVGYAWGMAYYGNLWTGPARIVDRGLVAQTTDFGRTWTPVAGGVGGPHPKHHWNGSESITFASPTVGFLYGVHRLWVTRDAGRTWHGRRLRAWIDDVESSGGLTWILVNGPRRGRLYRLDSAGRLHGSGLHRRFPDPGDASLAVNGPEVVVAENKVGNRVRAWVRGPAGRWARRGTPCAYGTLAFVTTESLAAVCGEEPGTGEQIKRAWSSADLGRHWQRLGDPGLFGYAATLSVSYPSTWLLGEGRGGIPVSCDGGRTWNCASTVSGHDCSMDEGWDTLGFTTPTEAMALPDDGESACLLTTEDGGRTWQFVHPHLLAASSG